MRFKERPLIKEKSTEVQQKQNKHKYTVSHKTALWITKTQKTEDHDDEIIIVAADDVVAAVSLML